MNVLYTERGLYYLNEYIVVTLIPGGNVKYGEMNQNINIVSKIKKFILLCVY